MTRPSRPRRAVLVFGRTPERDRVKSRLVPALGADRTLLLYGAFLRDSLLLARSAGEEVVWARTPGTDVPESALADRVLIQRGTTFGERLDHALEDTERALARDATYLVIGADTPHLSSGVLRRAFVELEQDPRNVVFGRCQAGGFYLLGFRGPPVAVARAFETTNEADGVERVLLRAGRKLRRLPEFYDIDTPADLDRLARTLESTLRGRRSRFGPRTTMDVLRQFGAFSPDGQGSLANDGSFGKPAAPRA